jgi:hypothetical protein
MGTASSIQRLVKVLHLLLEQELLSGSQKLLLLLLDQDLLLLIL